MMDWQELMVRSRDYELLQRLYSRFLLEPGPTRGESPRISSIIVPVTDADRLKGSLEVRGGSVSVTHGAGTGWSVFGNIPQAQEWIVYGWSVRVTSGDQTIDQMGVTDRTNSLTSRIGPVAASPGSALGSGWFPQGIPFDYRTVPAFHHIAGTIATNYEFEVYAQVRSGWPVRV